MRKIILYLLTGFISIFCAAQDSQIDSLKAVVKSAKEDTLKVNNLLTLSKSYFNSAPDEAINYSNEAKALAEKLHFQKGAAYALKNTGIAFYMQGKYVEALNYWQQSLAVFDSIGDKVGVANIQSNIGAVYYNQGDDTKALDYYLKSLKASEELNDTLRIATACMNIGAVYSNKPATQDKALEYYLRALPLSEALGDKDAIGTCTVNLGEIYLARGDDASALKYFQESLKVYEGSENVPYSLNDIGQVYSKRGDYESAIKYHQQAFEIAKKLNAKLDMTQSLIGLAKTYDQKGDSRLALATYQQAETIAKELGANNELKNTYEGMALSYAKLSDFRNAFKYQSLLTGIKDTLYNAEADKKLALLQFNFDIGKKQAQIDLLTKDKALQDLDLKRQKFVRDSLIGGLILVFIIAFIIIRNFRNKVKTSKILDKQKVEIENLLLNILPAEVAKELQTHGSAKPRFYESVSVLFSDFKGFTIIAEGLAPDALVAELNSFFNAFDDIIDKYNLEKIKTIGDAYMCAGGIPSVNSSHPISIIKAGLEIQEYIKTTNEKRKAMGLVTWDLRIGIHTGPVVAGVVGKKKYAYDTWGDTVNIASGMESSGEPGKVNISGSTYELVKDQFTFVYRGKIVAKNRGMIDMYFVEGVGEVAQENKSEASQ